MGGLGSTAATLRIGLVADIVQLLKSPRRLREQPEREPAATTGGVTLHAAAAWRTDVISSSLTARTLAINATTACNRDDRRSCSSLVFHCRHIEVIGGQDGQPIASPTIRVPRSTWRQRLHPPARIHATSVVFAFASLLLHATDQAPILSPQVQLARSVKRQRINPVAVVRAPWWRGDRITSMSL